MRIAPALGCVQNFSYRRSVADVTLRSMISRFRFVCVLGLAALMLNGCGRRDDHQLVIGMELSYPPFEMTDEHNQPSGIGVELARSLAERLHRELVIRNTAFTGLIPALQTGKIDLIISSMTATGQRAQSIDFSDPYMKTGICLLVSAKSNVQTVADLDQPGRRVVVKDGTTGSTYAQEHLPKAKVLRIGDEASCVLEVVQGKADAFIYDQMSIFQFQRLNPQTTRAVLEPFQKENWAIGIRKGNDELRRQVNAFLTDFKARHGLETLGEKYLRIDKEAFKTMGYPFSS